MKGGNKAFTVLEVIVAITILSILVTIAFTSISSYGNSSRNAARATDIKTIEKSLEIHFASKNTYPLPESFGTVSYSGATAFYQGTFGDSPYKEVGNLSNIPLDPISKKEYPYSVTANKNEYSLMAAYETEIVNNNIVNSSYASSDYYKPKISGTYNNYFIKAGEYYLASPSIITSEKIVLGELKLDEDNIDSFVTTNGKNIPEIGEKIKRSTKSLDINLKAYTGNISNESSKTEKAALVSTIQEAYIGTELENNPIYSELLSKQTVEEKVAVTDNILLGNKQIIK